MPAEGLGGKPARVEVYSRARFLTVTGAHLHGTPSTVEDRQVELAALHQRLFGARGAAVDGEKPQAGGLDLTETPTPEERALADRIWREHPDLERTWRKDESAGDLAFTKEVVRVVGGDEPQRIWRVIRASPVFIGKARQAKWLRGLRGQKCYATETITEAIKRVRAEAAQTPDAVGSTGERPLPTEPVLVRLSSVRPTRTRWLWEPYIPLGKLTFMDGDPGEGKTWLALAIAAKVTVGEPFVGATVDPATGTLTETVGFRRGEPAPVLYLTAEDGLDDTLRPRFDRLGGNPARFFVLAGGRAVGVERVRPITLADLSVLEDAIRQVHPVLVVLDPISAFLGAKVDMFRANETRPVMNGFRELAERYGFAGLCLRHLTKAQMQRAMYRGQGSMDFAGIARSLLLVGPLPGDDPARGSGRKAMVHVKSSLAPRGAPIGFDLTTEGFHWLGPMEGVTAATITAPETGPGDEEARYALEEAVEFLKELLKDGGQPADQVLREARSLHVSERTLRKAKARLGVLSVRAGYGQDGRWRWVLKGTTMTGTLQGRGGLGAPGGSVSGRHVRRHTPRARDPKAARERP